MNIHLKYKLMFLVKKCVSMATAIKETRLKINKPIVRDTKFWAPSSPTFRS